jgi:catechol 2,3-dioxygenase-like lactoylglutathione lyase family enzyme
MIISHVGLVCSSEEHADQFYANVLGLTKAAPKTLPAELTQSLFGYNKPIQILNYQNEGSHFEIFIDAGKQKNLPIEHTCIEVANMEEFLDTCRRMKVEVRQVSKGDKVIVFIEDYDGNLFEVKSGG